MGTKNPETRIPRIVVVGGGFAGTRLIKGLRKEPVNLVLIDRHNYNTFQPLMYQVATAGLEPGAIASPLRGLFEKHQNFQFRMARVNYVDWKNSLLKTSQGPIHYDYLVLATGARCNFFNNEQVVKHALTLNKLEDALSIRERFIQNFEIALMKREVANSKLMNVVIVGGGPTGVELAGAMAELKRNVLPRDYPDFDIKNLKIYLVEALDRLLPMMSEYAGERATEYLKELGVDVLTGKKLATCSSTGVEFDDGSKIDTNLFVWTAGVKPNGLRGFERYQTHKGRVVVDQTSRVKGTDNVFAVGDVASHEQVNDGKGHPMLASVAVQQGKHLAGNLKRMLQGKSMRPFRYHDRGVMATIGRRKAVAELPRGIQLGGSVAWYLWVVVHLWSILGLRRKILVMAHWMWSYFTYDKGNRLILDSRMKTRNHVSLEKSVSKRRVRNHGNQKQRSTVHL